MTNELIVRDLLSTMRKRICSGKSSDLDCCVLDFLRQLNLTYYEKFKTKEEAKLSIIDYLAFCNGKHTYSKLGYQSPLEFEHVFYRKTA